MRLKLALVVAAAAIVQYAAAMEPRLLAGAGNVVVSADCATDFPAAQAGACAPAPRVCESCLSRHACVYCSQCSVHAQLRQRDGYLHYYRDLRLHELPWARCLQERLQRLALYHVCACAEETCAVLVCRLVL